jgi:mRNA interferase RelE/StbE
MAYELYIERHAEKDLKKLPESLFSVIVENINNLSNNPHPPNSKKIKGSPSDWRIRIGNYRVLYEINNATKEIIIMRVKHRRDANRNL